MEEDDVFCSAAPVIADTTSEPCELPKSVLDYYISIEKVLEGEDFENESERSLLEEKLLDQIKCDGIQRILYHWDCSRVVERMLVGCTTATLHATGCLILPHIVDVASHNFASHVLELLVMRLIKEIRSNNGNTELVDLAEQIFRKLCLHVSELIATTHGSYSVRLAVQALAGHRVEDEKKGRKRWEIGKGCFPESTAGPGHPVLRKILHKFTKRLVKEDVVKMMGSSQGAPLLSVLLMVLHRTHSKSLAQLKSVIATSLQHDTVSEYKGVETFGPLPAVLLHDKGSYVIQSLIKVSDKAELEDLFTKYYKPLIIPLSLHPVANYTVQTFLEHVMSRDAADYICSQLVPLFEDLLAESITGVVIGVIKCCHHHGLSSYNFMEVLRDAFHLPEDQTHLLFRCLLSLTTHDILVEKIESYKKPTQSGKPRRDRFEATLTGSLLLQGLFNIGEIGLLEEGICGLSEDHLVYLSCNVQSSHALQAFLTSTAVPATAKHRFIKTAVFVTSKLVITPPGSRIVEAMWSAADNDLKCAIAQALMEREQSIKDNTYGAIVWRNCNLKTFKLGVKTWEDSERKKKRKIETFEKILKSEEDKKCEEEGTKENGNGNVPDTASALAGKEKKEISEPVVKKKKKKKVKSVEDSILPSSKRKKGISTNG